MTTQEQRSETSEAQLAEGERLPFGKWPGHVVFRQFGTLEFDWEQIKDCIERVGLEQAVRERVEGLAFGSRELMERQLADSIEKTLAAGGPEPGTEPFQRVELRILDEGGRAWEPLTASGGESA